MIYLDQDNIGAIEVAEKTDSPSDLLLCGIEGLYRNINNNIDELIDSKLLTDNNRFHIFFGTKPNEKFYYTICSIKDRKIVRYESGMGYCYEQGGKYYLKRLLPKCTGRNFSQSRYCTPNHFYNFEGLTVVFNNTPKNFSQLLCCENNIITSKSCSTPICLEIDSYSLLGRLGENLSSIPLDNPELIDILIKSLTQYKKTLSLKSNKLEAKNISTSSLQLQPHNNGNVKKNTLIYDETSDTIKFYNGTTWRTLTWAEDENAE